MHAQNPTGKLMSKKQVLIIEDNPDNMKLIEWVLEDADVEFEGYMTAEEGLERMNEIRFDLVLMDISLPGMDGKEATRKIRATPDIASTPIFAITAHAVQGEAEAILASGVDKLITKPIDEDALLNEIEALFEGDVA